MPICDKELISCVYIYSSSLGHMSFILCALAGADILGHP